jgi:hypothetical protein
MSWRRGQAYVQDLHDRVLAAEGATLREAAERVPALKIEAEVQWLSP